ncbi:hypothetical protein CI109_100056 [Kwoniella shandongensis]|uniref:RNA polymerase II subunit B1 CTD phosphatase RPAP2 homolog n=1 Tax=Kwoniella shandongensis TaxID=1734106 RepID=A0A5M6BS69_9TREE|nr:uncharacterized protein CI109_005971 [Kwoniella shandongensis]KAA5525663.1 hypothetical protein CI109_005971 [Kwoniella shandongensis]
MPIAVPVASTTSNPTITLSPPPSVNSTSTAPSPSSRNPVRLSVAQRDTTFEAGPSTESAAATANANANSHNEESEAYKRAAVRKITLKRRVDKWMDRLMEETVDQATFKKAASYFTPPQYLEVIHERHLNSLCSYPLCPNPPYRPYTAAKRYIISTRARTIKPSEGNEEEGFCGKKCRVRSGWVQGRLSGEAIWLRTGKVDVELLEELEERGEFSWENDSSKTGSTARKSRAAVDGQTRGKTDGDQTSTTSIRPATTPAPAPALRPNPPLAPAPAPAPSLPSAPTNSVSSLIANLTIHERPIPSTPTSAPTSTSSPTKSPTTALPLSRSPVQPVPQPQPAPRPSTQLNSTRDARRTANALISAPTSQLATTFISATKQVGPIHQLQDSDVEEEKEESDWEKEMSWGGEEDEETKALFEEARMAREFMEEK